MVVIISQRTRCMKVYRRRKKRLTFPFSRCSTTANLRIDFSRGERVFGYWLDEAPQLPVGQRVINQAMRYFDPFASSRSVNVLARTDHQHKNGERGLVASHVLVLSTHCSSPGRCQLMEAEQLEICKRSAGTWFVAETLCE